MKILEVMFDGVIEEEPSAPPVTALLVVYRALDGFSEGAWKDLIGCYHAEPFLFKARNIGICGRTQRQPRAPKART